ncbi:phosphoglycerate kinase [bacterium]|nr:phosphoglycerate kinase [bacterium]MBT4251193.1 phosphoglycerate kinase [bacterium]MBT4598015.1 phosphoglycerate kinase [bacterium]MBT6753572.1 phosphoglycerate kinase [bacterium]MBT7037687.1 phosphoglycerate kinase [bacterium]
MKTLKGLDLKDKRVVLRAEFNVPTSQGKIDDDTRIKKAVLTINHILSQETKALLVIAHIGRPGGKRDEEFSNKIVQGRLQELTKREVEIIEDVGEIDAVLKSADSNKIYLLENIRFWEEEEGGDEAFGKKIGEPFDVYVNDCFSTSHRAHASFVCVPKYTREKCMGLLFEEEYSNLSKVKNDPEHPAVMVIGGAKIATKLPVIENMIRIYDKVLVGGRIANEALDEKLDLGEKVLLPTDFNPKGKEDERLDIGDETIKEYIKEVENAKTIVWNGPLGKFEDEEASEGTKLVCRAIAQNEEALQVIGGGETLEAVSEFSDFSHFDYVSMSGGAMLEYLSGKTLPGIEALEDREE